MLESYRTTLVIKGNTWKNKAEEEMTGRISNTSDSSRMVDIDNKCAHEIIVSA